MVSKAQIPEVDVGAVGEQTLNLEGHVGKQTPNPKKDVPKPVIVVVVVVVLMVSAGPTKKGCERRPGFLHPGAFARKWEVKEGQASFT